MANNTRTLISIIVTTRNEELMIGRLIKSIKNQSYRHKEIILIDNSSIDDTKKIAKNLGIK